MLGSRTIDPFVTYKSCVSSLCSLLPSALHTRQPLRPGVEGAMDPRMRDVGFSLLPAAGHLFSFSFFLARIVGAP